MSTTIEETPVVTVDLPDPTFTSKDVLLLAADVIEKRGWCRGYFEHNSGRVCTLGAMRLATGGTAYDEYLNHRDAYREAEHVLRTYLQQRVKGFGPGDGISTWNDEHVPNGAMHALFHTGGGKHVAKTLRKVAAECA